MTSGECTQGLARLGINHATTLPYSPHQSGKIETYWSQVESTPMAMLESKKDVTLNELNRMTHARVEMDQVHGVTNQTPIDRFMSGDFVMRVRPSVQYVRMAFRIEEDRK